MRWTGELRAGIGVLAALLVATDAAADRVRLDDGSEIVGTIDSMADAALDLVTGFEIDADDDEDTTVTIDWTKVVGLESDADVVVDLADGSTLEGRLVASEVDGRVRVVAESIEAAVDIALSEIVALNPPPRETVAYTGHVDLGVTIAQGNTETVGANLGGEIKATTDSQRVKASGSYNYTEDSGSVTGRNWRGALGYDFFFTERFFVGSKVTVEQDDFQDLDLRTTVSVGPGWDMVKADDYTDWREGLSLTSRVGISYVDENRGVGDDEQYAAGNWAVDLDWEVLENVSLFHEHEGFVGLEDIEDLLVRSKQGLRVDLAAGLDVALQLDWDWDNTPTPGFERSDVKYMTKLGYSWDI